MLFDRLPRLQCHAKYHFLGRCPRLPCLLFEKNMFESRSAPVGLDFSREPPLQQLLVPFHTEKNWYTGSCTAGGNESGKKGRDEGILSLTVRHDQLVLVPGM